MATEYWRWPESGWTSPDVDCSTASVITAGVDVGSVSSQAAIMCDGKLYTYSNIRTGSDSGASGQRAIDKALETTGIKMEDIQYIVSTGYGRLNVPFANEAVNEIACHARGANFMYGDTTRTLIDMGGQDCKVIKCDEVGKVTTFMMNDKCASGTGRGIEVFADLVSVPIQDIGPLSLEVDEDPEPVSTTCSTFANSEAMNLMRTGSSRNKILASYCYALSHRVYTLLMRINPEKEMAITGGIAKNAGIVNRLEKLAGFNVATAKYDPQIAGAVGAAIMATGKVMS